MFTRKISQIPTQAGTLGGTEKFEVVQSGETKYVTAANIAAAATSVGTLSSLQITAATGTGDFALQITAATGAGGLPYVRTIDSTTGAINIFGSSASSGLIGTTSNHPFCFITNNTERARITSGGYFKASNDGTYAGSTAAYHELRQSAATEIVIQTNSNATLPLGTYTAFTAASPNNTTAYYEFYADSTTTRAVLYSNGDWQNVNGVYGTISDAKLKQDITDAGSSWDDLKAVRFRKYRFKSDVEARGEDAPYLLGVIAQELRETSPGLVNAHPDTERVEVEDEDGTTRTETRPTGTETLSVKQSILLMKAAVALQEAMARIETLEARLDALEN